MHETNGKGCLEGGGTEDVGKRGALFKAPGEGSGWPSEVGGRATGCLVLRKVENGQRSLVAEREGTFWRLISSL